MIKKTDVLAYEALDAERLKLKRQADAITKQMEAFEAAFEKEVRKSGGKILTLLRHGYIMAIKKQRTSVQWKPQFVRVAGLEAAEAIIAAAPWKEVFVMERQAAPAPAVSAPQAPPGFLPE